MFPCPSLELKEALVGPWKWRETIWKIQLEWRVSFNSEVFALFMRARVTLCNLWKRYCSVRISPLSSDMTFPVNHKGDKGARLSKACPRLTKEDYWPHPERAEACFIIKPWKRYFLHRWKAVWQCRGNFLANEQVYLWILAWNRSRRHKTWASLVVVVVAAALVGRRRAWGVWFSRICVGPCLPFRSGKSKKQQHQVLVSTTPARSSMKCCASRY